MPIRPCQKARYPKDWKVISLEVRERAEWRCEGSPGFYPDCRAAHAEPHPVTGSKVVILERLPDQPIIDWLDSLNPGQADLFGSAA